MNHMDTQIAGKTISVPVYDTTEHTRALVSRVNERLKEIEAESDRIDTQAFALRTALSFAAELAAYEQDVEEGETELYNQLDELNRKIDALNKQYHLSE